MSCRRSYVSSLDYCRDYHYLPPFSPQILLPQSPHHRRRRRRTGLLVEHGCMHPLVRDSPIFQPHQAKTFSSREKNATITRRHHITPAWSTTTAAVSTSCVLYVPCRWRAARLNPVEIEREGTPTRKRVLCSAGRNKARTAEWICSQTERGRIVVKNDSLPFGLRTARMRQTATGWMNPGGM